MTVGLETCYRVRGGAPLRGTVFVQGAKNAALKMIAASNSIARLRSNGHGHAAPWLHIGPTSGR